MRRAIREKNQLLSRTLALLREVEFGTEQRCPYCFGPTANKPSGPDGHVPGCELAALIRELSA